VILNHGIFSEFNKKNDENDEIKLTFYRSHCIKILWCHSFHNSK